MYAKYNESIILKLYKLLESGLLGKNLSDVRIDDVLKAILLNNGCKTRPESIPFQTTYDLIPGEYKLCFVTNMIGNDANEYYDFLNFNGMKYLVIFLDYFNIITEESIDANDPMHGLKIAMGNSIYYDAIKKIVEIYYLTSEPVPHGLLTTVMATTQRWNQSIIAIHILNKFKPVDDNDVSDISVEDIKKILEGDVYAQLYGVRTM